MDLFKELRNKSRYREFFNSLAQKVRKEPHRRTQSLSGSPVNPGWLLMNEESVTTRIIKSIKKKEYTPEPARFHMVKLDKERRLFSFTWPDKIVESVLSKAIAEIIEPGLSDRLFSFRKGRSNHQVVKELGAFISKAFNTGQAVYVVQQDVSSYGDNIDRTILFQKLGRVLGTQDDYIYKLLQRFAHPKFKNGAEDVLAETGIPTGCSLTPVFENLFLSDLDHQLDKDPALFYSRFGDDILIACLDPAAAILTDKTISEYLSQHKLEVKPEKRKLSILSSKETKHQDFRQKNNIEYLGYSIANTGSIFLSKRKEDELKKDFRMTAKKAAMAHRKKTPDKRVSLIVSSISTQLRKEFSHPYLEAALRIVDDSEKLRKLDTWIAKVCLRYVYKTGHDRVFRYKSLKSLRAIGLPSIVHLKNTFRRPRKDASNL